jgi:hypothetical protein
MISNGTIQNQNISMNHSRQSNGAVPAAERNSTLLRGDGETRPTCAHCRSEIVDGHWFCRLPGDKEPTFLCSPSCALHYFERSPAERKGQDQDGDTCEHLFHFFVNGEQPWS